MKQFILIISLAFFFPLFAQRTEIEIFWLQKTPVKLELTKYGSNSEKILFLNVHENESTSVSAAKDYLKTRNAYFMMIKHNGNRNLSFVLKGVKYQFDPNRMFTKAGRIANLKLLNGKYTNAAEETIEEFSDKIIKRVKDARIVIALHNNT